MHCTRGPIQRGRQGTRWACVHGYQKCPPCIHPHPAEKLVMSLDIRQRLDREGQQLNPRKRAASRMRRSGVARRLESRHGCHGHAPQQGFHPMLTRDSPVAVVGRDKLWNLGRTRQRYISAPSDLSMTLRRLTPSWCNLQVDRHRAQSAEQT